MRLIWCFVNYRAIVSLCDNGYVLPQIFYEQDSITLAKQLLGCTLVHRSPEGLTSGIIVETEAYHEGDEASHSFRGQTPRNSVMFGPAAHAYIYFTYGMHYCFNVVAGHQGTAEAVLIRALEPVEGLKLMAGRRHTLDEHNLCSGPAKLVQAMGLTKEQNGASLVSKNLFIKPRILNLESGISTSPRIGIKQAVHKPWRFFVSGSPYITKHKFNKQVLHPSKVPGTGQAAR